MKLKTLAVIEMALMACVGCSNNSSSGPLAYTAGSPLTGSYCTTWSQGVFNPDGTATPINISCLQADGTWKNEGGFPEAQSTNTSIYSYWDNGSLAIDNNGNLLLSYNRVLYPTPNTDETLMARYNRSSNSWSPVASTDVTGTPFTASYTGDTSQFGGTAFSFNGNPYYFWSTGSGALLTSLQTGAWSTTQVLPSLTQGIRYPEVYSSSLGSYVYLYFGEPSPTVVKFDGTTQTQIGTIAMDPSTEWTLCSSMTEWNGNPVIAYSDNNMPTIQNWSTVTSVTKVAMYSGSAWSYLSTGIEDTPGHDHIRSFVFTSGGTLYVMYPDYTTTGLPTVDDQIVFRFRVKSWNGSTWQQVGNESDPVYFSNRFEYLNDNGKILVNVVQPNPEGIGTRQIVLEWNGQFSYPGNGFHGWPGTFIMVARPGAIIKLN